jgi:flagellar hook-length control protein FliK
MKPSPLAPTLAASAASPLARPLQPVPPVRALPAVRPVQPEGAANSFSDDPFARMLDNQRLHQRQQARLQEQRQLDRHRDRAAAEAPRAELPTPAAVRPAQPVEGEAFAAPEQAPRALRTQPAQDGIPGARNRAQAAVTAASASEGASDERASRAGWQGNGGAARPTADAGAGGVQRRWHERPSPTQDRTRATGATTKGDQEADSATAADGEATASAAGTARAVRGARHARAYGSDSGPPASDTPVRAAGTATTAALQAPPQPVLGGHTEGLPASTEAQAGAAATSALLPARQTGVQAVAESGGAAATADTRFPPADATGPGGTGQPSLGVDPAAQARPAEEARTLANAAGRGEADTPLAAQAPAGATAALPASIAQPLVDSAPVAPPAPWAAPAQGHLQAPVGTPAFAGLVASQLTLWVRNGVRQAQLHLNPAEWGPVRVAIALDGSAAQVHLVAEHGSTRQTLEQALPTLAAHLAEAGFTLAGSGVFGQPAQRQDGGTQPGTPFGGGARNASDRGPETAGGNEPTQGIAPLMPRPRGLVDLLA